MRGRVFLGAVPNNLVNDALFKLLSLQLDESISNFAHFSEFLASSPLEEGIGSFTQPPQSMRALLEVVVFAGVVDLLLETLDFGEEVASLFGILHLNIMAPHAVHLDTG
jgi:hypothetical protein